ncbi:uncharacterized protein LOC26526435 [Drosophila erecta]|uniref:Kazal-like domain-containing protein n=1 Tax=Drosophila erecta TaxID=7220 RepID=A0A0Q5WKW7_DROER|nr:uncharacterized protein LOC26526435 [Drosophila erecta]KQS70098.1 uncharacterized protein Dere_GG26611 [Drosophila erecta]
MKLLWLMIIGVVAAQHCDKLCPIKDNFGCVSKDKQCFYTVRNPCILKAINCQRKSMSLSVLTPISRSKCSEKQVPVCKDVNT